VTPRRRRRRKKASPKLAVSRSLDEPADGQQNGRGRVDARRRDDGGGVVDAAGRLGPVAGRLRGTGDAALGGPSRPTVGRTAGTAGGQRADGTVDGGGADGRRVVVVAVDVVAVAPPVAAAAAARQQRLERVPEVLQMVRVQQRVAGRVEVRQDDARVQQRRRHGTLVAERLHAVDRVQRHPADREERDDRGQVLRGLHLALAGRAQHAQFRRAVAAPLAAVQQRHLFDLKRRYRMMNTRAEG